MTCKLKEQIAVNNAQRVFNVALKISLLLQLTLYKTLLAVGEGERKKERKKETKGRKEGKRRTEKQKAVGRKGEKEESYPAMKRRIRSHLGI